MGSVISAFTNADGSRRKAFIPFVTCGDPTIDVTEEVVVTMARAGAGLIGLGIPFSDPMAEGPMAQRANIRALANRITTDDVLDMAARLRGRIEAPLVLTAYANVVFSYGIERFAARAAEAGVAGMLLPDVPLEERREFDEPLAAVGLDLVSPVAPTSHHRTRSIAATARGFVCCMGSPGATETCPQTTDVDAMVALVRESNPLIPAVVSLDDPTPRQVAAMASRADGTIVSLAVTRIIEAHGTKAAPPVAEYVRRMVQAMHTT